MVEEICKIILVFIGLFISSFRPILMAVYSRHGKITSNKFLSGSQNAALMEDDKETSQNTLFANILTDRGVQEVFLDKVH